MEEKRSAVDVEIRGLLEVRGQDALAPNMVDSCRVIFVIHPLSRTYPLTPFLKEEGKRKKEKEAVTLRSVTSAIGLSQESNGSGLLRRAENRRRFLVNQSVYQ